MIRRILFGIGALAWGAASFLVGLYVTFPAEAARERVVYEFGAYTKDEYALGIGDLALWRLSGVALEDVTFYSVKKGRRTKDIPDPPMERSPVLHLDALSLRAAPVPMLLGKQAAAFVAEIYGGAIDGVFSQSAEQVQLSFEADDVDLSRLPITTEQMTLNLLGVLTGEADLTFDQTEVKQSSGFLRLSFQGLGLGAESAVAGFTLPEVAFTQAGVAFEVKDGKLVVTEGTFESDTLDAELTGDIVLNKKLARSRNRLELVFSLPEDLDKLAQIVPDLKRSRDDEGKYHLNIGGTILSPSARFTRAGVRRPGARDEDGPPPRLAGDDGPRLGGPIDKDLSDEDRQEARKRRIEERRERLRKRREEAEARNPLKNGDGPRDRGDFEDDFEPDDMRDGPRFPPEGPMMDGPMDGPMMDGPMMDPMDGPPMDDMGPEFDPGME